MILFNNVSEIFGVAEEDRGVVVTVVALNGLGIRPPLVNGDLLREPLVPNRLAQEGLRSSSLALWGQQKIHGLALFVDGTIKVGPLPFNFHVGLVEPPALSHRPGAVAKLLLDLWGILNHPAIEGGVIDRHPALFHHLFELAIAAQVRNIPPHTPQDDFLFKVTALKVHSSTSP